MSLHGLTSITLGVPDVAETARYYEEFGLTPLSSRQPADIATGSPTPAAADPEARRFATVDGGEQLVITHASQRKLLRISIGADDLDDLERITASLARLGVGVGRNGDQLAVRDPNSGLDVTIRVSPRLTQAASKQEPTNGPGRADRANRRAPAVERTERVRPRRLGHVVVGSLDQEASQRFFTEGLGFKVSDRVPGLASFLRCSTDHHNLLLQQAPLNFLHHSAWEVDDVDDVGRGAAAMLEGNPDRHVWGLGRHHIGSNYFWYLKDPAGNFSEYYSDLDCIVDDQLWKPSVVEGARGLYNWGPPPSPSFLNPDDLAALMTGSHQPR
jgi:catechol 2,3-dioxygenase-like lactoylglutathione lyase family enzyme